MEEGRDPVAVVSTEIIQEEASRAKHPYASEKRRREELRLCEEIARLFSL